MIAWVQSFSLILIMNKLRHSVFGPTRPAFLSSTRFRKSLISLFVKTCLIPHSSRCSKPVALLPKRESLCTKLNHLSHYRSQKTNFMTPTIVRDQFLENRANIVLPFISAILGFSKCNTYTIAGNIAYKDYVRRNFHVFLCWNHYLKRE